MKYMTGIERGKKQQAYGCHDFITMLTLEDANLGVPLVAFVTRGLINLDKRKSFGIVPL